MSLTFPRLRTHRHYAQGFTIVELLIVIIVIAILATISVVSYSGVQNSARSAKMMTALDAYADAVSVYKAATGTFPNPTPGTNGYYCLGDYSAQPPFAANSCMNLGGGQIYSNSTLNSQFASVIGTLPDTSDIVVTMSSGKVRGIQYSINADSAGGFLIYYVAGANQKCGRGQAQSLDDMTECRIDISKL